MQLVMQLKVVFTQITPTGAKMLVCATHTGVMIRLGAPPLPLIVMITMIALMTLVMIQLDV
jgi:hypothetical protein